MSLELRPYPEYKDSHVEWLGSVPEHWNVLPNRALFTIIDDRNHPEEQLLSVTISQGVIPQESLLASTAKKDGSNLDKTAYKLVQLGDIVYNKMRAWQGAVGSSGHRGIVSPAYVVARGRVPLVPRYYHFLLRAPAFATEAERWSYGITSDQWSLRPDHFRLIYSTLPPLDEQSAIVHFLDRIDLRFRRLIRAKRRQIELLNEQKQAIIHQAVTRGLDSDVPLKPSGVEWLGDVPAHWEMRRLKDLFTEVDDRSATGSEELLSLRMYEGLVPHQLVSSKPISSNALIGYKKVQPRNVVMNRMRAATGLFAVASSNGLVSPDYAIFERKTVLSEEYFVYLFKTQMMRDIFKIESKGLGTGSSGFMRLYTDRFGSIRVPFPPPVEQEAIVMQLNESTTELNDAMDRMRSEIDLIREYRTRLIADVVTGKVDVRGVELPELDEDDDVMWDDGGAEDDDLMGHDEELSEQAADN